MIYLSTLIFSMFITIVLIPPFRRLAIRMHALDIPDERKVHTHPIPKSGGIAMALGTIIPVIFWVRGNPLITAIFLGSMIIVLFGLVDDLKDLGYKFKFIGQVAAALLVILLGGLKIKSLGVLLPGDILLSDWIAIPLTLMIIVGVTNAINLSDGLDGLAGGICLLIFICIGYLGYLGENQPVAILSVAIAGAIFGFLRFNTYPAVLFMGDTGSQFLGFLAATLSIHLTQEVRPISPLLPLIILGFPILDTITVMVERLHEGKSPFIADKKHFHHKLIRLGFYHTEAVLIIYILQAFLITSAYFLRYYSDWFLAIFYLVFSGIILILFSITDKTGWTFKRTGSFDKVIKGRLKELKERQLFIKISFRILTISVPLLFLFTCFLPSDIPMYFVYFSWGILGFFILIWLFKKKYLGGALRIVFYLIIPFIVYLSHTHTVSWMNEHTTQLYNLSFGGLILFVILTLKFTRRREGFKISPLDFLILFIAMIVPNLPDQWIQSYHLGLIATKIVVLFFSYEVLLGELRNRLHGIGIATIAALMVLTVKGISAFGGW